MSLLGGRTGPPLYFPSDEAACAQEPAKLLQEARSLVEHALRRMSLPPIVHGLVERSRKLEAGMGQAQSKLKKQNTRHGLTMVAFCCILQQRLPKKLHILPTDTYLEPQAWQVFSDDVAAPSRPVSHVSPPGDMYL